MKRHKSFIIIIEGLDGAGKNTLAQALKKHLETNSDSFNHDGNDIESVELYSFPDYNSITGNLIKETMVKHPDDSESIAALFALDRKVQNTGEDEPYIIKIFDRYYASNYVYQSNLDFDYLESLERDSYRGDVTFILDIPPEVSFERRPNRRDNYEKDISRMNVARTDYLNLAHRFGWVVLKGEKTTNELVNDIIIHCCYRMNKGLENIYYE